MGIHAEAVREEVICIEVPRSEFPYVLGTVVGAEPREELALRADPREADVEQEHDAAFLRVDLPNELECGLHQDFPSSRAMMRSVRRLAPGIITKAVVAATGQAIA